MVAVRSTAVESTGPGAGVAVLPARVSDGEVWGRGGSVDRREVRPRSRRAVGPRPVRPVTGVPRRTGALHAVVVGPRRAAGPGGVALGERVALGRTLSRPVRRPVRTVSSRRYALRRAVAAVGLGLVAMLAVVALGLVAEAAGAANARATVPAGTATVLVGPGETAWDVARRAVPEADPAAVVERISADNEVVGVGSAVLPEGTALRVPA